MADILTLPESRPAAQLTAGIELVGRSAAIGRVHELVRRSALLDTGVLIVGERGADVRSVAREIHALSRPAAAWIAIECGASDAAHLERALFGVPRGRLSSDLESVSPDSRIAAARGGTLFLQDTSELPAAVQARLARVA